LPWGIAAGVTVSALGAAAWGTPAASTLLGDPAVQVAIALAWIIASMKALATGLRRRDLSVTRVGLGLALLAAGELYRVWIGVSPADPDLLLSGVEVVGTLAVLGGVVGRNRGDVISMQVDREQQRAALRDAAEHVEGAAAVAAERDHELANGLAGLNGIAYLLEHLAVTPEEAELRSAVVAEIARLHSLLAGSGHQGEDDPFDVAHVLSELVVLRRGSGMDVDVDAVDGLVAAGGRGAFSQAATNLLANCARHAPGSPVRMRAFARDDRVVVEVRDQGPGVPSGREQDVVERGTTAAPTGGSGLGLHVSARLLRERNGDLRVLPRQPRERGFVVRLELPLVDKADRGTPTTVRELAAG
jgi:two-component system OmpR family sensor kinase